MIERTVIIGTGLIGTSIGLAMRRAGYTGTLIGIDQNTSESAHAKHLGAIDRAVSPEHRALDVACTADLIILAVPVMAIMHWIELLAPLLGPEVLVTDTGSTKSTICELARRSFTGVGRARFLPGHPMAGKEQGGAAMGDAALFDDAMWLFTPIDQADTEHQAEWRSWVTKFGCRTLELDPEKHDRLCAWISHLPQFVATAMAAMLQDELLREPELAEEFRLIGGRALREMTRLGASPFSMWRDIAHTNTMPVAATLFAMEQRLAHLRENLKTPELREEFMKANRFRKS